MVLAAADTNIRMKVIARVRSDFPTKFGIPRQSGLVPSLCSTIIFEPTYRNEDALRGLSEFSHLWLIWGFSETERDTWSPTVRPPRLGGNERVGVFATRSTFRPNAIGLSSVKLESIENHPIDGTVLIVSGADLMDGTPIYDIKPYLPFTDCHPDAKGGFTDTHEKQKLEVTFPESLAATIPLKIKQTLIEVLTQDPHPAYQHSPERIYGFEFAGYEIKFCVEGNNLKVVSIDSRQRL